MKPLKHQPVHGLKWLWIVCIVLFLPLQPALAQAELPSGGDVIAGEVTINAPSGDMLAVDQASQYGIVDWQSFSIGAGGEVRFNNASGATLNRVTGGDISAIHGRLSATGSAYLINEAGIVIGPDGVVRTGGTFVASTLDVHNEDFLDGGRLTFAGGSAAGVINQGQVLAVDGDVALIGRNVINEGHLAAPKGTVGLAAGREVVMRDASDGGRFEVVVGHPDSKVEERGTVEAAQAELRANGGNVYALAGNTDGLVKATGVEKRGGRIFLSAGGGGKVRVTKKLEARGGRVEVSAGKVAVEKSQIDTSDAAGTGGQIDIGGEHAEIEITEAWLDASGQSGGQIRIGGAARGRDDPLIAPADLVSVSDGTVIDVSGTGQGGQAILWSQRRTDFTGRITAQGGTGGFAEVSSRGVLSYAGHTDTGGGTLLLDPKNIIVNNSGGTGDADTSYMTVGTITGDLASNNVMIAVDSGDGSNADGNITVNDPILYSSPNDLTFLAMGDVQFNASVQNSGTSGGDINIVAGWDGYSNGPHPTYNPDNTFNAGFFNGIPVTAYGSPYGFDGASGQSAGTVIIGDGSQNAGIAVGARSGATRVYTADVAIKGGSNGGTNPYAQLGFRAMGQGTGYDISGNILLRSRGDVSLSGGGTAYGSAMIGHVGTDTTGNSSNIDASTTSTANIRIETAGAITATGGRSYGSVQIGHGGARAGGSQAGDITVLAQKDITFTGGAGGGSYALLGHGGNVGTGTHSGDISVTTPGTLKFTASSSNWFAYAQIGHGGSSAPSEGNSGDIKITATAGVKFTAGKHTRTGNTSNHTQIGHGGTGVAGDHYGDIRITTDGALTFTGGVDEQDYAQIGHGGYNAPGDQEGSIDVTAGSVSFEGGTGKYTYAQIGHSGYGNKGNDGTTDIPLALAGTITVEADGAIGIRGGSDADTYAMIGHGGGGGGLYDSDANITVIGNAALSLVSGTGSRSGAQIGHGGYWTSGAYNGAIAVDVAGDLTIMGDSSAAQIGHGDAAIGVDGDKKSTGTRQGNITITAGGEISIADGNTDWSAYGWIGHSSLDETDTSNADILVTAVAFDRDGSTSVAAGASGELSLDILANGMFGGDVTFRAKNSGYALVDTAPGIYAPDDYTYSAPHHLTLMASHDISFTGGGVQNSHASGGDINLIAGWNGTSAFDAGIFDAIDVTASPTLFGNNSGNVIIGGGSQSTSIAVGSRGGTTRAYGNDISLIANSVYLRYAQLGFSAAEKGAGYDISGAISVRGLGDVTLRGGDGDTGESYASAQIGHIGVDTPYDSSDEELLDASTTGTASISVLTGGDITASAGSGKYSFVQIGHGGFDADSETQSGSITIEAKSGAISVTGGTGERSYAQFGHGGDFSSGTFAGDITITAADGLSFAGKSGKWAYTQIGHGGYNVGGNTTGTASGDITVTTGKAISFAGGSGEVVYSQIGHGGYLSAGNFSGNITVTAQTEGISFTAGNDNFRAYAQIGHGGLEQDAGSASKTGAIRVEATEDAINFTGGAEVGYARIGHGGYNYLNTGTDTINGIIDVTAGTTLAFSAGDGWGAHAQIGHGGHDADGTFGGDITVTANGEYLGGQALSFAAGLGHLAYVQLGHGGYNADGEQDADDNVIATKSGAITVTASAGGLRFSGGLDDGDTTNSDRAKYAQLGHGGYTVKGDLAGVIDITAGAALEFAAGEGSHAYAQIGHGGTYSDGRKSDAITVTAGTDLVFLGGKGGHTYVQIGHGGLEQNAGSTSTGGNIAVEATAGALSFAAGAGKNAYAQLGHGGYDVNAAGTVAIKGNITALAGTQLCRRRGRGRLCPSWPWRQ